MKATLEQQKLNMKLIKRRVAVKRQLRKLGVPIPEASMQDLAELRQLRKNRLNLSLCNNCGSEMPSPPYIWDYSWEPLTRQTTCPKCHYWEEARGCGCGHVKLVTPKITACPNCHESLQ